MVSYETRTFETKDNSEKPPPILKQSPSKVVCSYYSKGFDKAFVGVLYQKRNELEDILYILSPIYQKNLHIPYSENLKLKYPLYPLRIRYLHCICTSDARSR